jgi:hypothetical protein
MSGAMNDEPAPSTLEQHLAFYARFLHNLQTRVPDPVEDAEREAHFETWKRRGVKRK